MPRMLPQLVQVMLLMRVRLSRLKMIPDITNPEVPTPDPRPRTLNRVVVLGAFKLKSTYDKIRYLYRNLKEFLKVPPSKPQIPT